MEKPFDLSGLEAMCGGDAQFMADFVQLFIDSIPQTLTEIEKFKEEQDWNSVGGSLHKIKPTVEMFQMGALSDLLKETEKLARNGGNPETIKSNLTIILPGLKDAVEQLKPELAK